MKAAEPAFEELAHTAEVGLRVRGRTWEELLVNAARGMFHLIRGEAEPARSGESVREVEVEAGDRESLLVEWLSALLSLHDTHGEVYQDFQVQDASAGRVRARLVGSRLQGYRLQIKAVTYHALEVRQTDREWVAQVTFDV